MTTTTTMLSRPRWPPSPNRPCQSLVTFLLLLLLTSLADSTRVHYVHWNTSNPIFRIDNTDHIIDVNRGNQPWEYDQANIICPVYKKGGTMHEEEEVSSSSSSEKYIVYNVSREEYETCRITTPNPRVIAVCDNPTQLMYFTITFRSFTPTPGGMEFKPGKDYYFISTSSGEDLHRRVGGRCSSHNMKVMFKVADSSVVKQQVRVNNSDAAVGSTAATVVSLSNKPKAFPSQADSLNYYYPAREVVVSELDSNGLDEVRRRSRYEKSAAAGGVIKQEASRMQHSEEEEVGEGQSGDARRNVFASGLLLSVVLASVLLQQMMLR